jgi:hypothetical protein
MTQDFNLLGAGPKTGRRKPAALPVGVAAAAALAIGLAAGYWLDTRADAAEKRIEAANLAVEDLILNLQERSQFLAQRNADPALVAKLQQLERESADKGKVLDLLAGRTLGNTAGFSAQLAALGRRYPDGLWVRQLEISDGGRRLAIHGGAVDAVLVPRFIGALREEPAFRGTSFERFVLEDRPGEGGNVRFTLASGCEAGGEAIDAADCVETGTGAAP